MATIRGKTWRIMAWIAAANTIFIGASEAQVRAIARDPYIGAIVVNAESGEVLLENRADERAYPASMAKLMTLLLVQERIDAGLLKKDEMVTTSANASRMGGSQVWLKEKEQFPVEELLYALMVQSANDAAVALAEHLSGSEAAFVERMNQRASELGMTATRFTSASGLPITGREPDISTARDMARLACEMVRHPALLAYTSTKERGFRNGQVAMRNHNALLRLLPNCDGLKTGWFRAGGYSVAATATNANGRVIAVVMGSAQRLERDRIARELLLTHLERLPLRPPPAPPPATNIVTVPIPPAAGKEAAPHSGGQVWRWGLIGLVGAAVVGGCGYLIGRWSLPREK